LIKIVCFKWKSAGETFRYREPYTAEHVNIFAAMINRHVKTPHEVICFTDDPRGINVKTIPIWDDLAEYQMCYRRLKLFSSEMKTLIGDKFIALDIDCIIKGDITDIVEFKEDFKIFQPRTTKTPYNGGLFGMNPGSRAFVWDDFNTEDLVWMPQKRGGHRYVHKKAHDMGYTVGSDQAYISYKLYPKEKTWTQINGIGLFPDVLQKKNNPADLRLIFLNGKYDPSQKDLQEKYPWIKNNWTIHQ
jgi:hypothetical protein